MQRVRRVVKIIKIAEQGAYIINRRLEKTNLRSGQNYWRKGKKNLRVKEEISRIRKVQICFRPQD